MRKISKIKNMDVEWDYSEERGPEKWASLCEWFASGAQYPYQSPINLTQKLVDTTTNDYKITFHYKKEEFTEKEFKNTFHFIPPNTESYILFEEDKYYLIDIHFHTPSEHTIEEKQFPLEFHLVHMNNKGENLVVGCLFTITTEENKFSKGREVFEWKLYSHEQSFDPTIFLPTQRTHFHYLGSLTTPPTKGPVHWFVFDTIQKMDREFIQLIKEGMLPFNNRPIQPLNNRKVYFSD